MSRNVYFRRTIYDTPKNERINLPRTSSVLESEYKENIVGTKDRVTSRDSSKDSSSFQLPYKATLSLLTVVIIEVLCVERDDSNEVP